MDFNFYSSIYNRCDSYDSGYGLETALIVPLTWQVCREAKVAETRQFGYSEQPCGSDAILLVINSLM